jgi:hypothetical protein
MGDEPSGMLAQEDIALRSLVLFSLLKLILSVWFFLNFWLDKDEKSVFW